MHSPATIMSLETYEQTAIWERERLAESLARIAIHAISKAGVATKTQGRDHTK
jgi:hypothetical protein